MAATNKLNLPFLATLNSRVCSSSIYGYNNKMANMTTMCSGSKVSGKTEMDDMNLFIPRDQIVAKTSQLETRIEETGGASLLGKNGQPWPGLYVCSGCPMVNFKKYNKIVY